MGGIGIVQLLVILAMVMVLFGTGKLKNIGSDLGAAIKGFRHAAKDENGKPKKLTTNEE